MISSLSFVSNNTNYTCIFTFAFATPTVIKLANIINSLAHYAKGTQKIFTSNYCY